MLLRRSLKVLVVTALLGSASVLAADAPKAYQNVGQVSEATHTGPEPDRPRRVFPVETW